MGGFEADTDDMVELYVFENRKLIEDLTETVLEHKDAESFDENTVKVIFRTMHTMKGSAGLMMYEETAKLAHKMEDVFYYIRESKPKNIDCGKVIDYVLKVCDYISNDIDFVEEGKVNPEDPSALIDEIDKLLEEMKAANPEETPKSEAPAQESAFVGTKKQLYVAPAQKGAAYSHYYRIIIHYKESTQMPNMRAYRTVRGLGTLGGELVYSPENIIFDNSTSDIIMKDGFRILIGTGADERQIKHVIDTDEDVKDATIDAINGSEFYRGFGKQKDSDKKQLAPGDFVIAGQMKASGRGNLDTEAAVRASKGTLIPVNIKKLEGIIEELSELEDIAGKENTSEDVRRMISEVKRELFSMKKVPLTKTFQRMNRLVFDASRKLGKNVECVMIGDDEVMDTGMIENISDPLMHIVRNAVDHGIEMPEERVSAGKPPKGRITLEAREDGSNFIISVSDDGFGLDRSRIIQKAVEKGLTDEKSTAEMEDSEVYKFILQPGFSTNDEVSEFSGRGVGMDVVAAALERVGGVLKIDSEKNKGTTFSMVLPA